MPKRAVPEPARLNYDLERALTSVVALQTQIPEDALTAETLGTERSGHGVLIGDRGLIATIGYLITEAETIWRRWQRTSQRTPRRVGPPCAAQCS